MTIKKQLKPVLLLIAICLNITAIHSQIQFNSYIAYSTGSWPKAVSINDLNNDGRKDVALGMGSYGTSNNNYKVLVYIQNISGTLNTPVTYSYGSAFPEISTLDTADLNQDGKIDMIVGIGTQIGVFFQNNSGTFNPITVIETGASIISLKTADLNNDNITDFAIATTNNEAAVKVYFQNTPGNFTGVSFPKPYIPAFKDIDIKDINNDGKNDLIFASSNPNAIYTYYQTSANSFDAYNTISLNIPSFFSNFSAGDLNNDGKTDLAITSGGNSPNAKVSILYQNANSVTFDAPVDLSAYDIPEPIRIADLNNDTKNEIIAVHGGWLKASIFQQNNNLFNTYSLYNIPYASHYGNQAIAIGDINNDNKKDIAIADYNNGLVILYNASTLSIENNSENLNKTILYPNPATDHFTIQSNIYTTYEIIDINGKKIVSNKVESQKPIDISTLQNGFYFVILKTEREKTTYKLIKN